MKKIFTLIVSLLCVIISFAQTIQLDNSFNSTGNPPGSILENISLVDSATSLIVQQDGKIIVAGNSNLNQVTLVRYNIDGIKDGAFGEAGISKTIYGSYCNVYSITLQADGKIVVAGYAGDENGDLDLLILRFNTNGQLDNTFNGDGIFRFHIGTIDIINGIAIDNNNNIVFVGEANSKVLLGKINSQGEFNTSFGSNGIKIVDISPLQNVSASSIAVKEADNSIYFSGKVGSINKNFLLGGFDQNGDPLSNFGLNGIVTTDISSEDIANCIKLVGEYILVGGSSILNGEHNFAIVKYTNQGEIEETFGTSGIITTNINPGSDDIAYSIDLQKDGDILLGGFSMLGLETNYAVVRYTSDGTLDTSFDVDGKVTINIGTNVHASAMTLSSYRIYLAGTSDDKDFSIAAISNNELALPVQLSSFVAVSKGATVDITWTSASETNTSLFVIERSLDGKHYSSLGQVTASKNSHTTRSYLFTDLKPSLINYYRLKVVDQDGRVSYGRVVVVRSATETSFSISPNPVHASFQVAIADPSVSSLTIYAVSGVPIRVINLPQAKGKRIVPVEAGSLASGTYFIKAGKQSIRFTKL